MKTNLLAACGCTAVLFCAIKSNAQANKSLSNLISPTAVNQHLLPKLNDSLDLGSNTLHWRNLYFGNAIYSGGTRAFKYDGQKFNVYIGGNAGNANTTGAENVVLGYDALIANTSGWNNTAIGNHTLSKNTTGLFNTAIGTNALDSNTTGNYNVAVGSTALQDNSTGLANIGVGAGALRWCSTGNNNIGVGYQSLGSNNGSNNVGIGTWALQINQTGTDNTAVGYATLFQSGTGSYNSAFGSQALYFGYGSKNTAVGYQAGMNTSGSNNTYLGYTAGSIDQTSNNTAIGYRAGYSVLNGPGCTYLGCLAGPMVSNLTNTTGIGYNVTPTASNQVRIGNSSVTSIGGQVGWTTFSDGRYKKNIKENVPGLAFINQLKPITYTLDVTGIRTYKGEAAKDQSTDKNENVAQEKIIHTGFIAQDVEAVAKKMNYDFDGVDAPKNNKDLYGIRYDEFVVPLVKAVQELSKQNDEKDLKIDALQKQIDDLKAMIVSGKQNSQPVSDNLMVNNNTSSLLQNAPNPFSSSTIIKYNIPSSASNAQIAITDNRGNTVKTINLTGKGAGQITLATGSLSSGDYFYSLLVNGKKVETKQMQILK